MDAEKGTTTVERFDRHAYYRARERAKRRLAVAHDAEFRALLAIELATERGRRTAS